MAARFNENLLLADLMDETNRFPTNARKIRTQLSGCQPCKSHAKGLRSIQARTFAASLRSMACQTFDGEVPMPARELQERLNSLREQLDRNVPLSDEELAALHEEARQIEAQLKLENATPDNNLADGVNLAVERFEADHPDLTATLRSIANSLHSMGI